MWHFAASAGSASSLIKCLRNMCTRDAQPALSPGRTLAQRRLWRIHSIISGIQRRCIPGFQHYTTSPSLPNSAGSPSLLAKTMPTSSSKNRNDRVPVLETNQGNASPAFTRTSAANTVKEMPRNFQKRRHSTSPVASTLI